MLVTGFYLQAAVVLDQLATAESAARKYKVGFESSELAAKLLKRDLATSEAKAERMKEAERIFEKEGCVDLRKASSHFIVTIRRLLSEPPSTSLDLYHKERNKKELGEVIAAIAAIEGPLSDIIAHGDCQCDIPKGFTCEVCECSMAKPALDKATQILKRLIE